MLSIRSGRTGRTAVLLALLLGFACLGGPANAVINGANVTRAPGWVAYLESTRTNNFVAQCTGSLVAPDWVLTAGHCVSEAQPYLQGEIYTGAVPKAGYVTVPFRPIRLANIELTLGVAKVTASTKRLHVTAVRFALKSGFTLTFTPGTVHCPGTTRNTCHKIAGVVPDSDAALLRLAAPSAAAPVILGASVDGPAQAYGYGVTSTTQTRSDGQLRTTKGVPYRLAHCGEGNGYKDLCATRGTSAVFHGDSGGPWLQTQQGRRVEVALTSGGGLGTVFPVDMDKMLDWIHAVIAPTPPPPAGMHTAFVLDEADNAVTPIDTQTNKAGPPIPVGTAPQAITATPDGRTVFVLDYGQDAAVWPIDTATRKAGAPIKVGAWPAGPMVISSDGKTLYVLSNNSQVIPIDTATKKAGAAITRTVAASQFTAEAITPDGRTLYVLDSEGHRLFPIDTASGKVGTAIDTPSFVPTGLAIDPSGTTAYISESCCGVVPVTLATGAVGNDIRVRDASGAISFTPDGRTAFMPDFADSAVESFTTATRVVDPLIPTATQTVRLLLTPDGRSLYAVYNGYELLPLDVATRKAGAPIAMDAWYLAATPDSATVYVSNRDRNTVTPVAVASGKAGTPIPVGHKPTLLVIVP